ncbi:MULTISPECIES: TetR/AcrR family transcriptional regulator [Arthrobacter]|uniref:TetR/AcrR family transcriptional regulator n=1 Tax=Arthrobacter TaxID=1663 RepID=UPI003390A98B
MSVKQGQAGSRTGDDARTLILDAAEELMAHNGFNGTSIAQSAGAAKKLLFYYFPSKSELLVALMAEELPATAWDVDLLAIPGVLPPD